jgi:gliotoxin/aspirochlorine biosynthesis peptide synthetase
MKDSMMAPATSAEEGVVFDEVSSVLDIPRVSLNPNASFISQGGHSLLAVRLSSLCRARGVQLAVNDILRAKSLYEVARFSQKTNGSARTQDGYLDPSQPVSVKTQDTASLMLRWEQTVECLATVGIDYPLAWANDVDSQWSSDTDSTPGTRSPGTPFREDSSTSESSSTTPLSTPSKSASPQPTSELWKITSLNEIQLSLIHGSVKNAGTNIIHYYEDYAPSDIPRVKEAWRQVVELEPMLQIRYSTETEPQASSSGTLTGFRWTDETVNDEERYKQMLLARPTSAEICCSFLNLTVVDSAGTPQRSTVIWTIHHALIDGYSASLVLAKVRNALLGRQIVASPSFTLVSQQVRGLQIARKAEGNAYWAAQKDRLAESVDALQIPPPLEPSTGISEITIPLKFPVGEFEKLARQLDVTPAILYHTGWALLFSLYTSSENVVFGTVLSGRNLPIPGIESTVGPLVNTLPLQVSLPRDLPLRDVVKQVGQRMTELAEYQWTSPANGFSRSFQSALALQFDYAPDHAERLPVKLLGKPISRYVTDIPLSVAIHHGDCLRVTYNSAEFSHTSIESVGNVYELALKSLFSPEASVDTALASLISRESYHKLRSFGNCGSLMTQITSVHDDLVTLFERAARLNPAAIAVEKGEVQLTYKDFDSQAATIAKILSAKIQPGEVVCVDADRSINWVVSMIGILKAGGVYCALDRSLSNELRTSMFKQSGSRIFIMPSADGIGRAPHANQLNIFVHEMLQSGAQRLPSRPAPNPSASAYLCFTSGSTGVPKGVVCSHEGLVAFERDLEVRLHAGPGIKVSQIMSVAFDGSIHEMFSALSYGATLVLQSSADPFEILDRVDSCILTPSVAEALDPDDFPRLRYV